MATDTSISCAQKVITCDLCDNPIQHFCNRCQVSLCEECINKHVRNQKSLTHEIAPFKEGNIQIVFSECKFHPNQRCEAQCQQCDVPVCMICVTTSHNGHKVRDITNIFNDKKKEIQEEIHEIESSILPRFTKKNEDTDTEIAKFVNKYIELEKELENQRQFWHQEVDIIFNKLSSMIQSMKDDHMAVLKLHQTKLKNLIADMIETVEQNKKMLKSNKVSQVNNFKPKVEEYRDIPEVTDVLIPLLKTNTVQGRDLSIELGERKATLAQTSTKELLDKAKVIATFSTGIKPIFRVVCVGADKSWVSEKGRTIRCVDIHGSVHDTVTPTLNSSDDSPKPKEEELICISVNRNGELMYSDYNNRTVNIYRHERTEIMITSPNDWNPAGLTSTKSGDILVNLYNGDQNKIVRYQGQKVVNEIFKDENEKPIYGSGKYMLFVEENNNEDICVSDRNADTVVVVDKTGRVRFRFDGTPAKRKETFDPNELVTDSLSQIIVTDWRNNCLHILDQDGQFLKCVDNCDLSNPRGLSLDNEGRLWVGLYGKGEVKVIEYTK
ncbi:uncharacterized protein LOC133194882 [Saccostrea echinata]|uniref:uncharacterized protein LOC133194882 n=1 Tax=Saccostrea echinata TaxID=191078 RepID=UPI002A82BCE8|nr:uncharacterized protein LOC133194882 [Saccostrea echinata]